MRKSYFLTLLLLSFSSIYSKTVYPVEIISKETFLEKNWFNIITIAFAIVTLIYTSRSLRMMVKARNLTFLGEIDKMMVEKPSLWRFYDSYNIKKNQDFKAADFDGELLAFTYFKLNHFEIILLDKNMSPRTAKAWHKFMGYCLTHSSVLKEEVVKIISCQEDYRGIFGKRFEVKLFKIYSKYFPSEIEGIKTNRAAYFKNINKRDYLYF